MSMVFVIDDDPLCREPVTELLVRLGYRAIGFGTGADALEAVRHRAPGLVILDWRLPDMSGAEVLRRLRAGPGTAAVPVIVLSGTMNTDAIVEATGLGVNTLIVKRSFSLPEFLARIRDQLDALSIPATPGPGPSTGSPPTNPAGTGGGLHGA